MATAKKLPSGLWSIQVCCKKKRKRFSAKTKEEAEQKAMEWVIKRRGGVPKFYSGLTLYGAMTDYANRKLHKTRSAYLSISNHAFPQLQNRPLKDLTVEEVLEATKEEVHRRCIININKNIDDCKISDKTIAPKTVENDIRFLATVLRYYRPETNWQFEYPSIPQKDNEELPSFETVWYAVLCKRDYVLRYAVLLSAWLGLSLSEICGLNKGDVDDDYIFVRRKRWGKKKNLVRERRVKLPKYFAKLNPYIRRAENKSDYYFWADDLLPVSSNAISQRFRRVMIDAGIKATFRDLIEIGKIQKKEKDGIERAMKRVEERIRKEKGLE